MTPKKRKPAAKKAKVIIKNSGPKRRAPRPPQVNVALPGLLKRHCAMLVEHFDTIQIVATKLESDGSTSRINCGSGNSFARVFSTEVWVGQARNGIEG